MTSFISAGHHFSDSNNIPLNINNIGLGLTNFKCIYKIKCLVNNKVYIGSTINASKRFNKHKRDLINNKHHSIALQNAFNKYGLSNFCFEILEECTFENIQHREQFFIDGYQSYKRNKGYNIIKDAYRGILGFKHSEETKIKISIASKNMSPESIKQGAIARTGRFVSKDTCLKIAKSHQKFNYSRELLIVLYVFFNLRRNDLAEFLGVKDRTLKCNLKRLGITKTKQNFIDIVNDNLNNKRKDFVI